MAYPLRKGTVLTCRLSMHSILHPKLSVSCLCGPGTNDISGHFSIWLLYHWGCHWNWATIYKCLMQENILFSDLYIWLVCVLVNIYMSITALLGTDNAHHLCSAQETCPYCLTYMIFYHMTSHITLIVYIFSSPVLTVKNKILQITDY